MPPDASFKKFHLVTPCNFEECIVPFYITNVEKQTIGEIMFIPETANLTEFVIAFFWGGGGGVIVFIWLYVWKFLIFKSG